ncbi:hypothetical protein HPB52_004327 [Rhipicephalus sanguineus]|uniref:ASCC3-like N-terminal domain-containing protein n=1 Tax=Rhipicephalus sanguineus TaxID=34632 RepID=A0A9D4PKQ7_RHISA|nr:hypothetical protein HPB52_004327 [Rhipicephalus sanguineus]
MGLSWSGGDCLEEVLHAGALQLLEIFQDGGHSHVTEHQRQQLKRAFGSFPAELANRACALVHKIFSWLTPEVRQLLLEQKYSLEDSFPEATEFARRIKVGSFQQLVDDEVDACSEDELFVQDQACLDISYREPTVTEPPSRYDGHWLRTQVQRALLRGSNLGLSVEELVNIVAPMLDSHRTDKELEGEQQNPTCL